MVVWVKNTKMAFCSSEERRRRRREPCKERREYNFLLEEKYRACGQDSKKDWLPRKKGSKRIVEV